MPLPASSPSPSATAERRLFTTSIPRGEAVDGREEGYDGLHREEGSTDVVRSRWRRDPAIPSDGLVVGLFPPAAPEPTRPPGEHVAPSASRLRPQGARKVGAVDALPTGRRRRAAAAIKAAVFLAVFASTPPLAGALRIQELAFPGYAMLGQTVTMVCEYSVGEGQYVDSVKWYRDGQEFYRILLHTPRESERVRVFPRQGISVDRAKSGVSLIAKVIV